MRPTINRSMIHGDIQAKVYDIRMFFWHKEDSSFSQEASTLNIGVGYTPTQFFIENEKTGNKVLFYYKKTLYYGTGEDKEVGGWEYYSSDNKYTATIWND